MSDIAVNCDVGDVGGDQMSVSPAAIEAAFVIHESFSLSPKHFVPSSPDGYLEKAIQTACETYAADLTRQLAEKDGRLLQTGKALSDAVETIESLNARLEEKDAGQRVIDAAVRKDMDGYRERLSELSRELETSQARVKELEEMNAEWFNYDKVVRDLRSQLAASQAELAELRKDGRLLHNAMLTLKRIGVDQPNDTRWQAMEARHTYYAIDAAKEQP